jgi:hypothetical protein
MTRDEISVGVIVLTTMVTASLIGWLAGAHVYRPFALILAIAIFFFMILGLMVRSIAVAKGIGDVDYFWAGFFFFPIALIVALLIPARSIEPQAQRCPDHSR